MENLKKINKLVKNKQHLRIIGGIGFIGIGLCLLFDYYEQNGWTQCQKFICTCYPEEYAAITKKIAEKVG